MSYTPTQWNTGDTITASALNKIEQGIANAGSGKYDAYDFIVSQVDSGTPVLEKGTWQGIYDALQNMEHVIGLYLWNSTPNAQWHDTTSLFVPLTFVNYYSSADEIYSLAMYYDDNRMHVRVQWSSDGTIVVTKNSA